jgi:hypothetical protein
VLIVLVVVLAVCIAGFSGVLAAEATAFDADYVAGVMEQADAYRGMEATVTGIVATEANASLGRETLLGRDEDVLRGAVERVITPEYVRSQARVNLRRTYDFLHGRSDSLRFVVGTGPLTGAVPAAVAAEIRAIPLAGFVERSAVGASAGSLGLDAERLGETVRNRTAFRETQTAVGRRLDASDRDRDDVNRSLREATTLGDVPVGVERAVYDLQGTVVLAMTTETTHEEYVARLAARRAAFADAVGTSARREFEREVGATVDLTGWVRPAGVDRLQQGRRVVRGAGTLVVVFPFVALATLAAALRRTGSVGRTVRILGGGLCTVAVVGLLAGVIGGGWSVGAARASTAGAESFVAATAVAVVEGLFGRLVFQSAVIAVLGVAAVGLSVPLIRSER